MFCQGIVCDSCGANNCQCLLLVGGEPCPPCFLTRRSCTFTNPLLYLETLRFYRDTEYFKLSVSPNFPCIPCPNFILDSSHERDRFLADFYPPAKSSFDLFDYYSYHAEILA